MTYAIIQTGGKQLRVEPGRFYDVELLTAEPDQTITLETVLLVQHNSDVTIGHLLLTGNRRGYGDATPARSQSARLQK